MRPKKHRPNHKVTMQLVGAEVEDEVVLAAMKEVSDQSRSVILI
jgi:hypothetical protein